MKKPIIPSEIIEEIGLKEPISMKKIVTLIYDSKQYSIKIPTGIIEEIEWKASDKIEVEIENGELKLRKSKG